MEMCQRLKWRGAKKKNDLFFLLSEGQGEAMPRSPTLSMLAEPLACSPLEAAEAGGEAMLLLVEEEVVPRDEVNQEVPVEEVTQEEVPVD